MNNEIFEFGDIKECAVCKTTQKTIHICKDCIKKAREDVFKQLEDNSIKAVLPANRIHVCIREDIFVNLKSVQFAGKR